MMCWGRGNLENRFQVIKSARNRPRQVELGAEEKPGFSPILSPPSLAVQSWQVGVLLWPSVSPSAEGGGGCQSRGCWAFLEFCGMGPPLVGKSLGGDLRRGGQGPGQVLRSQGNMHPLQEGQCRGYACCAGRCSWAW